MVGGVNQCALSVSVSFRSRASQPRAAVRGSGCPVTMAYGLNERAGLRDRRYGDNRGWYRGKSLSSLKQKDYICVRAYFFSIFKEVYHYEENPDYRYHAVR